MRAYLLWVLVVCSTCWAGSSLDPVLKGPEGQRAFDELGKYYANNKSETGLNQALADLKGADAVKRKAAGAYLHALLMQLFADESNGRAPWKSTPFFGGRPICDAREYRKAVAKAVGEQAGGAESLAAIEWLLFEEKDAPNQAAGMQALERLEGPAAAELFKKLLAQPHPNAKVAEKVVALAGQRKMKDLAPEMVKLCGHYRTSVREAARAAAPDAGVAKPPAYAAETAFTPWLEGQLEQIRKCVAYEIPSNASFMKFTPKGEKARSFGAFVVLEEQRGGYHVIDWWGRSQKLAHDQVKAEPWSLAAAAKELTEWRANAKQPRDVVEKLSREGGMTGQFEPNFVALPEALVGAWAVEKGEKAAAAALLFPRLDAMADDRWLAWVARDLLGHPYFQKMLHHFSHERDYGAALKLALHLSQPIFDEYTYQDEAQKLAGELAKRGDDFKSFKLLTPAEWKTLQVKLDRSAQVAYLAERLKLLNCIQMSQPGDVNYADKQFAEPYALGGKTEVINPFNELRAMNLQPQDLAALAPFVKDDAYIPSFGYWRDFHHKRTIHRVNFVVAAVLNEAAKKDLAKLGEWSGLDEAAKQKHIDGILAWCEANKGKTREQLPDELPKQPQGGMRIDAP